MNFDQNTIRNNGSKTPGEPGQYRYSTVLYCIHVLYSSLLYEFIALGFRALRLEFHLHEIYNVVKTEIYHPLKTEKPELKLKA